MDLEKEARELGGDDVVGYASPRILDSMRGRDFVLCVTRAGREATVAVDVLDDMVMWVTRLQPYFDFDPEMTVARALELYLKDRARLTPAKTSEL